MPSSSSSEEDLSKFQEATDSTLYNDSLFRNKLGSESKHEKLDVVALPSLRHVEEEGDKIHNELRVTPSFQNHVAKHLSKLLDSKFEIDEKSLEQSESSNQTRNILKAKRSSNSSGVQVAQGSGVRLLGASAVFLSNLNIAPSTTRRRKRGRKTSNVSCNSDSSSEESCSDIEKLSAAAVSPDWILSGAATKGWAVREGKVERCTVDKSGKLVPARDDLARGYESLNEMSSNSKHFKKSDMHQVKDDLAVGKLIRRERLLESELAASFSSVVSIGSDSQGDVVSKLRKKKKKMKKVRRDHYSEDATTETTEVEDTVEERRKKVKKSKHKSKRRRREEKEAENSEQAKECVPGMEDDFVKCKKKKKKLKKLKRLQERDDKSFLKKKCHHSKTISRKTGKKKMARKVLHLAEDLSKLMMTPNDSMKQI